MSTNQPFIRKIELMIYSQTEDKGGGSAGQALTIRSDGGHEGLAVDFDVKKTLQSTPNDSNVAITNLSKPQRERIRTSLGFVQLKVGWRNTGLSLLAQGAIKEVVSDPSGTEYITGIKFLDGFAAQAKGISNKSFGPNLEVSGVVQDIAKDMPGLEIGQVDVEGKLGSGGLTASGRSSDELDMLGNQYGFTWSIQDGRFQALDDKKAFEKIFEISAQNKNLIRATPKLDGAMQTNSGIAIDAVLDPRARPGDQVRLTSEANDQLNGLYKIHTIVFVGGTFQDEFKMRMECYKVRSE